MAKRRQMYEVKTVRTERQAAALIKKGWQVTTGGSSGTWLWGRRTSITLRRLNPKYRGTIADVHSMTEDEHGLTLRGRMRKGGKR